jgi:hypothetical protein
VTAVAQLRAALLWAAGRPGAAPDAVDEETLYHALDVHRLDARLLRRVAADGGPFSAQLLAAVRERYERTSERVAGQVATATELARAVATRSPVDRLVLLKGFTLYGLTGDPAAIRRSADLDVIVADLDGFVRTALDSGFSQVGEPDVLAEYAQLHCDRRGLVELHSYFPVTFLDADGYDCAPSAHPGRWEQPARFDVYKLTYPDLAGQLAPDRPAVHPVGLLRPELAIIVYASHFFIDYILNLYPLPVGTVRLDEVATIVDLAARPGFDPDLFTELVKRFHAEHVVGFARAAARDLLDRDLFADRPDPGPVDRLTARDLWWDGLGGFPVELGWEPEQTVVRDLDFAALLDRVGANPVDLAGVDASRRVTAPGTGGEELARFIYRAAPGRAFDTVCDLTARDSALELRISLPAAPDDHMSGVSLNFGDRRFEFFYKPGAGEFRWADYSNVPAPDNGIRAAAETSAGRDTVTVGIPWSTLGGRLPGDLPLLLGVRQQRREWGPMSGGVMVPMLLGVG